MDEVRTGIVEHIPQLRRYAQALAHNPMAADDLVQECLARALTKSHLFRPGTNLRAWLFTILHNLHVSEARRIRRTVVLVDTDDTAMRLATPANQDSRLVIKALETALYLLPPTQRELILWAALGDMSYCDAAERFDVPVGTVKSRLSRGRHALRETLEGRPPLARARPRHKASGRRQLESCRHA